MLTLKFPFEKRSSSIFGQVFRPIAKVSFWSSKIKRWVEIIMIVDTGADYTLLPRFYALDLGIHLRKDCIPYSTTGIGGTEKVYIFKKAKVKLGKFERIIPLGFLNRDNIPPLLGRQDFLQTFKVVFYKHITYFQA